MKKYLYIFRNSFLENHKSKVIFLITLLQPPIQIYGYLLFSSFLIKPLNVNSILPQSLILYYLFILVVSSIDLPRFGRDIQADILSEQYLNLEKLPLNPFVFYLIRSLGKNCILLLLSLLVATGYLLSIQYPLTGIVLFIIASLFAFILAHAIFFTLACITFYFEEVHMWLFNIIFEFLSGKMIPLMFMPSWLSVLILSILPFSYAYGALAQQFSEFNLYKIVGTLVVTLVWTSILLHWSNKLWIKGSYHFQESS